MTIFPFRHQLETSPLRALFLLDHFLGHHLRHQLLRLLTFILIIFILVFVAIWLAPLIAGLAQFLLWLKPRLPEFVGIAFIILALWLVVYLFEMFFRHRYFATLAALAKSGPSFDVGRLLFNATEPDLLIALLTAEVGTVWLARLGVNFELRDQFLAERREKKIAIPFDFASLQSLPALAGFLVDGQADFAKWLLALEVKKNEAVGAAEWVETARLNRRDAERWWTRERLGRIPGLAKDWAYGESYLLNQYSLDLLKVPETRRRITSVTWYQSAVEQLEAILMRSREANALIVGQASAPLEVVYEFTALVRSGKIFPQLETKHPKLLRTAILLARFKDRQGLESEMVKIFNEVNQSGNVMLVIDDLPSFVARATELGANLEQLLDPYLASGRIQVVALAETDAYHRVIESNSSLGTRFEVIKLETSSAAALVARLLEAVPEVEERYRHRLTFTYQAILTLADLGEQFTNGEPAFDRAVDFLVEVAPWAMQEGYGVVNKTEVLKFVSQKLRIPLGAVEQEEQNKLLNLEKSLHERVIGQDQAIVAIANTLRRSRAGIRNLKRPLGSFLFLGPTGVGKTEMAKALAAVFFGGEDRLLRLDMSEYAGADALKRLIGSSETSEPGTLVKLLHDDPYGVLLLDEFEKTNLQVLNLFLQILDEGFFSDMRGERVNARHILFVATSNAGAPLIWELVGAGRRLMEVEKVIVESLIKQNIFKPELLNRFDGTIIFNPLTTKESQAIARLLLEKLALRLKEQNLVFQITDAVVDAVVKGGTDQQFGARPINRFIQDHLEQTVATALIKKDLKSGAEFSFDANLQLMIKSV